MRSVLLTRYIVPIMPASLTGAAGAQQLTLERIFAAPDLSGPSLRSAEISPDGRLIAYLRGKETAKDRMDLWAYDIGSGAHRLLIDSASLAPEERTPDSQEEQRRERARIAALGGIVDYEFSPDSRYLLVPLGGDLYVYDLNAAVDQAVRRLTRGAGYATEAHFSPHGSYVSFVRDQNLFVHELASGTERALTLDGGGPLSYATAEFIAQEEMDRMRGYWWSPDERSIAFTRVDESAVAWVQRFQVQAGGLQVLRQRYPAAGGTNAAVQLLVAPLANGSAPVGVDLGSDPDFYLARVTWFPDGTQLAVQRQSRDQKTLTLLAAQALTGETRQLLAEQSDTWVELNDELTFLEHSALFIWASSRSGFKHLYLYDLHGHLVRPLTGGSWEVTGEGAGRAIRGVDEQRSLLYFMGSLESPLERHLYSLSLANPSAPPDRLTNEAGWHAVTMSKDARVFLDTFSTPEEPPSLSLRTASGELLAVLVPNALKQDHPYAPYLSAHQPTEFGTLQAADGQTLYYQIIRPRDLVPGQRYPVIVDVYGGPGVQRVRRAWGGYPRSNEGFFRQYLAQHGYVVFTLDNRGSAARGKRFSSSIYHQLGSVEVHDQVAGVGFLETLPYVDPQRIGIFGWSYGGYLSLMCILKAPDAFAAAAAGAPVTDWQLYDTHYTERFMGTPKENRQGYEASSVLTQADRLRRPLLILHGMADDNVLFTHSTALFKLLQDRNTPFEMMTYPGSKHGLLRQQEAGLHAYATIVRFFDRQLRAG